MASDSRASVCREHLRPNAADTQRVTHALIPSGSSTRTDTHTRAQTSPIPQTLPFPTPPRLRLLRRCTVPLLENFHNANIPLLRQHYDLVAARPTNERTLQQACQTLDVDIVSLDLSQRFETFFKFPMFSAAVKRGVKIELCYAQGLTSADANAKRNAISNATQLIRVTRGRGLMFSSEAKSVLGLRAPNDVINLASVWGLGHERGKDGLTKEPRSVVEFARLKKTSFRGVVDVVYGGEKPVEEGKKAQKAQAKRKAAEGVQGGQTPLSKRALKKQKKEEALAEQIAPVEREAAP